MGNESIEAIYEHGGFRIIKPADLNLSEGQRVRLVVEAVMGSNDILALATQIYEGLTPEQIDAIEEHLKRRENFFGERLAI